MVEIFQEVFASIKQHKTRSTLTGFGVAWGMFILIILLGAGQGFRSGVLNMFSGYASNSFWITGFWTTKATLNGMQEGSRVAFNRDILEKLTRKFPQIDLISSEIPININYTVTYKKNKGNFEVKGVGAEYLKIKTINVGRGRIFNEKDFLDRRRVLIIGGQVMKMLFDNENPIGKYINISGVFFQVVGVINDGTLLSTMEQNNIYAPDEVIYNIFNPEHEFNTIGMLLKGGTSVESFENEIRMFLSKEAGFSCDDKRALYINNIQLQVKSFNSLFKGINIFLWVFGLCILLTGMIGISNIMLVVVKERTSEIGIRKAIGATPNSILILIISESIIITTLFGVIGLIFGYGGIILYNWIMSSLQNGTQEVFARASIDGYVVYSSLLLLILSGVLAGVIPAKKAAEIMPIETLNSEK